MLTEAVQPHNTDEGPQQTAYILLSAALHTTRFNRGVDDSWLLSIKLTNIVELWSNSWIIHCIKNGIPFSFDND